MKKGMHTYIIIYKLLVFGVVLAHQTSKLMKPKALLFAAFFAALIHSVCAHTGSIGAETATPGSKLTTSRFFAAPYAPATNAIYTVGENDFHIVRNGAAAGTIIHPVSTAGPGASVLYQKYRCS